MTIKRKLIHSERFIHLLDDPTLKPVSLTFSISVKGNIPEERVRIALEKLQTKHPALRAHLKGKYVYYEDSGYPPISVQIEERVSENTWQELKGKFINEPYNCEEGPLMKLLWVRSDKISEFVFNALHVIADWKSCILIIKEFYEYLNFPDKEVKPYLPIRSLNELMEGEKLTILEKIIAPWIFEKMRRGFVKGAKGKKQEHPQHYHISSYASSELTQKLTKLCKENKVYIGSLFCILVLRIFKKHFNPEKSVRKIHMSLDQRRYFPPLKKDMLFAAGAVLFPNVRIIDGMDVWKMARTFDEMLYERTVVLPRDPNHPKIVTRKDRVLYSFRKSLLITEYFNRMIKEMINFKKNTDDGNDFIFYNLGKPFPLPKNPEYEMNKVYAPEIYLPFHNPTTFGFGFGYDDNLIFAFIGNELHIPKEKMELIFSEFNEALDEIVKDVKI